MPSNKDLDDGMFEEMGQLADLKKKTHQDRDRVYGYFNDFLKKNRVINDLEDLEELIKTKEGRAKFSKYHAAYFYSLRVRDNEFPKLATAESMRSHIKNKILKDFCIDFTNPESFPSEQVNWRKYTIKLTM